MPPTIGATTPGLAAFLSFIRGNSVESSIEQLVSLIKHRQICGSEACAIATAYLLRRVVGVFRVTDVAKLIGRVQEVGRRLVAAQPKELAVGNIVGRVLGVIRDEAEEDRGGEAGTKQDTGTVGWHGEGRIRHTLESSMDAGFSAFATVTSNERPPLLTTHTSYVGWNNAPAATSLFSLLSHPPSKNVSPLSHPPTQSPAQHLPRATTVQSGLNDARDLRAEVVEGIQEIIDELKQADDQIASYAQDHIHSDEIILTYTPSMTVQKFLLKAAVKRKFTVVYAEAYSTESQLDQIQVVRAAGSSYKDSISERFQKALTEAGISVLLVPYSTSFALMSRVTKVILNANLALADGGLVAAAGAKGIAKAARMHRTPVLVISGVYKLSPVYTFDVEKLIEHGDPSNIVAFEEGSLIEKIDLNNPLFDYIAADLVDLYVTNLGGHAPSYLYRIVADHYRNEDMHLAELGMT